MTIEVPPASPADADAIRAVHVAAFPTPLEADLVAALEQAGDATLSLVAEQGGRIVGHILLSRMRVEGDGRDYRAVGLAPVAVVPECRRRGLGGRLIEQALGIARDRGEELVFLVGEPEYYRRFGFSAAAAAPFASPYAGPYLMARRLTGVELPAAGRADYAPAFAAPG